MLLALILFHTLLRPSWRDFQLENIYLEIDVCVSSVRMSPPPPSCLSNLFSILERQNLQIRECYNQLSLRLQCIPLTMSGSCSATRRQSRDTVTFHPRYHLSREYLELCSRLRIQEKWTSFFKWERSVSNAGPVWFLHHLKALRSE